MIKHELSMDGSLDFNFPAQNQQYISQHNNATNNSSSSNIISNNLINHNNNNIITGTNLISDESPVASVAAPPAQTSVSTSTHSQAQYPNRTSNVTSPSWVHCE